MKVIVMLWLMTAGVGISYAVYEERKNRIKLLKEMEESLGKLAYFMYEWRMPAEEAFLKMSKEAFPMLQSLFIEVLEGIQKRRVENLGELWNTASNKAFETMMLDEEIKELWCDCFLNIPIEPEALQKSIGSKRERLQTYLKELQDKYKVEQKLVWTLGLCVSGFLCLIIW